MKSFFSRTSTTGIDRWAVRRRPGPARPPPPHAPAPDAPARPFPCPGARPPHVEGAARVGGAAGLGRGEDELAPHLDHVLLDPPVPDTETERLGRQPLLAEHLHGRGEGQAGGVAVRGGGSRRSACSRSSCTESRPISISGYQARGECASSSARDQTASSAPARVPALVPLLGVRADDLGEGVEGLDVVGVLAEHGPQPRLLRGRRRHRRRCRRPPRCRWPLPASRRRMRSSTPMCPSRAEADPSGRLHVDSPVRRVSPGAGSTLTRPAALGDHAGAPLRAPRTAGEVAGWDADQRSSACRCGAGR